MVTGQSLHPPAASAHSAEDRLPARTIAHWIPAAILLLTLGVIFLRGADFPAGGRGMDSAESAHSHSPIDDDTSPDPILTGADGLFIRSGKNRNALPFGTVRKPSLAISPPAPPPKS
jgi:hypothetical protein